MIDGYSTRLITITIFMAISFIEPQRVGFRLESPGKQCSGKRIFSFHISCSFFLFRSLVLREIIATSDERFESPTDRENRQAVTGQFFPRLGVKIKKNI